MSGFIKTYQYGEVSLGEGSQGAPFTIHKFLENLSEETLSQITTNNGSLKAPYNVSILKDTRNNKEDALNLKTDLTRHAISFNGSIWSDLGIFIGSSGRPFELDEFFVEFTANDITTIEESNTTTDDTNPYVISIAKDNRSQEEISGAENPIFKKNLDKRLLSYANKTWKDWGYFIGDTGHTGGTGGPGDPVAAGIASGSFESSLTWEFAHNLTRKWVIVECIDHEDHAIIPDNIFYKDDNTVIVSWATPQAGNIICSSGGGQRGPVGPAGPPGGPTGGTGGVGKDLVHIPWELKTETFTAEVNKRYLVKSNMQILLPPSPQIGDEVSIKTADTLTNLNANPPQIFRNGNLLMGVNENLSINGTGGVILTFTGEDCGWVA